MIGLLARVLGEHEQLEQLDRRVPPFGVPARGGQPDRCHRGQPLGLEMAQQVVADERVFIPLQPEVVQEELRKLE